MRDVRFMYFKIQVPVDERVPGQYEDEGRAWYGAESSSRPFKNYYFLLNYDFLVRQYSSTLGILFKLCYFWDLFSALSVMMFGFGIITNCIGSLLVYSSFIDVFVPSNKTIDVCSYWVNILVNLKYGFTALQHTLNILRVLQYNSPQSHVVHSQPSRSIFYGCVCQALELGVQACELGIEPMCWSCWRSWVCNGFSQ